MNIAVQLRPVREVDPITDPAPFVSMATAPVLKAWWRWRELESPPSWKRFRPSDHVSFLGQATLFGLEDEHWRVRLIGETPKDLLGVDPTGEIVSVALPAPLGAATAQRLVGIAGHRSPAFVRSSLIEPKRRDWLQIDELYLPFATQPSEDGPAQIDRILCFAFYAGKGDAKARRTPPKDWRHRIADAVPAL